MNFQLIRRKKQNIKLHKIYEVGECMEKMSMELKWKIKKKNFTMEIVERDIVFLHHKSWFMSITTTFIYFESSRWIFQYLINNFSVLVSSRAFFQLRIQYLRKFSGNANWRMQTKYEENIWRTIYAMHGIDSWYIYQVHGLHLE